MTGWLILLGLLAFLTIPALLVADAHRRGGLSRRAVSRLHAALAAGPIVWYLGMLGAAVEAIARGADFDAPLDSAIKTRLVTESAALVAGWATLLSAPTYVGTGLMRAAGSARRRLAGLAAYVTGWACLGLDPGDVLGWLVWI